MDRDSGDDGRSEDSARSAVRSRDSPAQSGDTVVLSVADGEIRSVRGESESLLDRHPADIEGRPIGSLVAGQEGLSAAEFRQTVCAGRVTDCEVALAGADGPVPVTVTVTPVPGRDETVCVLDGTPDSRDPLVEQVGDPVVVLDADLQVTRVNAAMVDRTGYARDELVGRSMAELVPSRDHERLAGRLREVAATDDRSSATVPLRVVTRDGTVLSTEANLTVTAEPAGEHERSVGVLRDISERRRRERDLELLTDVLCRAFRHNVRNELNVAQAHAELLRDELDGDLDSRARKILAATGRMLAHSEKVRRIERAVNVRETVEVDLVAAVEGGVDTVTGRYPEAPVTVELPESVTVTAHPRIEAAITELLDNAVRHAPSPRDTRVEVRVEQKRGTVRLVVADASGGIPARDVEILRRGTESEMEHLDGLGLWLVRWLVDSSDADLTVRQTGDGSAVCIRFGQGETASAPVSLVPADQTPARVRGEAVVGRVDELHRLEEAYRTLEPKGGQVAFVTGAQGVGKTTLAETFLDGLPGWADRSPVTAAGYCTDGITPPYHVFRQLFDALPSGAGLIDVFADVEVFAADDAGGVQDQRGSLFADIADRLRDLAADRPVVLVVEDLHLADQSTVALFEYLVDEVARWTLPVLFVVTARTGDPASEHPVDELADRVAPGRTVTVDLGPLDREAVRNLLRHLLDVDRVPPAVLDEVHDQTGGNPLFVTEVGRELADRVGPGPVPDDLLTGHEGILSDTVGQAVTDRIDACPDPDRAVLELGAVLGETVAVPVLVAASERPATAVRDSVDRLVARRLWERSDGTVTFAHGVVREQLLAALTDDRRRQCHRQAAEAIETVHEDTLERYHGRLGEHYEAGGRPARAIEQYRQAGERALGTYGHEVAIESYERALELALAHDTLDDGTLAALYADLARASWATGANRDAAEQAREGLALAPEGSRVRCRLLDVRANAEVARSEFDSAEATTRTQRDLAASLGARNLEASAHRRLGSIARRRSEYDRAREQYRTALEIARETDNRLLESRIRLGIAGIAYHQGQFEQAHEDATGSLEMVRAVGDRRQEARTLNFLGAVASKRDRYDRAREYYRACLDIQGRLGNRYKQARTLGNLGLVARRQGNYDEALDHYEQSLSMAQRLDDRSGEAYSRHNLGEVAVYRGACDRAREHLERSLTLVRELGDNRVEVANLVRLGDCERVAGNLDRAAEHYREALSLARDRGHPERMAESSRGLAAVARHRGAYDEARERLDEALSADEDRDDRSGVGKTRLALGRLALARDDTDRAVEQATLARELFAELNKTHQRGRCRLLLGRVAADRGDTDVARDHWRQALDSFETVDAPRDQLRVLELLVENCRGHDDDQFRRWCGRARSVLDDAPPSVVDHHETWVETTTSDPD